MTRIIKMVMRGFKSFATKTELVFDDNFTVVLGPNGSGKSNVLDALCFVLGKGSAKGLRAEKSMNLIYNGGKTKNPAKEAEVAIFFDNKSKIFPTDDEVVKISRLVRKNGQSKYRINDKTRTRQQILDLLSVAKIDPDGYNIILQGDITRFVEMSPVSRREIVEEIAGIGVYEEKRQKAVRELEKVEEKLKEADIILNERKTHLKELKSDRDQAMKYKDLEGKRDSNKATLLHRQISEKKSKKQGLDKNISGFKEKIDGLRKEIEKHRKIIEEKKQETQKLSAEVERKGEKEQIEVHKRVEVLRIDLATSKTRVNFCENEIQRIKQRKEQLEKSIEEIDDKIKEIDSDRISLANRRDGKEKELTMVEKKIASFKKDHNLDAAGDIEKSVDELDKKADEKQKQIQEFREQQQNLLRQKDKLELQISSIDEKMYKVAEVEKEHKAELETLKDKKKRFKFVTLELNKLLNEDSSVAAQLATARQRQQSANEKLSRLMAENASIKQTLAGSEAIGKILSNKNKFKGIHDLVSNLGNVSSKYAMALEVAAGPRIKSIVVETDKVAADCIKYLKKNRLGIATFLPLNKIKSQYDAQKMNSIEKTNGVVGPAIDLITFQPKFRKVFEYVFGNTVVVDDIDVTRRLGVGEARMVTLDGDLAETSGAMHGGFRQRLKGIGFQEKEVAKDIEENERVVQEIEIVLSGLENKKVEHEEKLSSLRKEKGELEGDIIKIEKSLHLDSVDLDSSKKVKKEFEEELVKVDKDVFEVQNKISEFNKELAEAKIKRQELRGQIIDLRSPVKLAELNTFEQKRSELKEELASLAGEIKAAGAQGETIYGPEKEKIMQIMKQHDKENKDFKDEISTLKDRVTEVEKELKVTEKTEKEFYSQFKDLFTRRNKITEEQQQIENKVFQKDEQIRTIEEKVNAHSLDNARITAELSALEGEFSQYKDADILKDKSDDELKKELYDFEKMVENLGAVNMRALEIYENVEREYHGLLKKKETLDVEKQDVLMMMNEVETKKKDIFVKTFDVVNEHFKKFFDMLTTKGDASLILENPNDPLSEGVRIKVRIAGNKFLDIRSLSGGEKTLTALAFIFSIQEHDPASFYILDEVDAALDKRNSEKLAKMISDYSKRAQYVVISHNDGIISEADTLYGISMADHGVSKVVSLKI